jgi:hypothetical protein
MDEIVKMLNSVGWTMPTICAKTVGMAHPTKADLFGKI